MPHVRRVVRLAALRGEKVLLLQKGAGWFFPGGRVQIFETAEEALRAKLHSQLPRLYVNWERLTGLVTLFGEARKGETSVFTLYVCPDIDGYFEPRAGIGISAVELVARSDYPLSDITHRMWDQLVAHGYLSG